MATIEQILYSAKEVQLDINCLADDVIRKFQEICKARQISNYGEGIRPKSAYVGVQRIEEIFLESDDNDGYSLCYSLENDECVYSFDELNNNEIVRIGVDVFNHFKNEKEYIESGKHKLKIYRSEYQSFPEMMNADGVTDDELQEIADIIDNLLYNEYNFNEGDLDLYIKDKTMLSEINDEVFNDIDDAFYRELELVGLKHGVVYESDIENEWGED